MICWSFSALRVNNSAAMFAGVAVEAKALVETVSAYAWAMAVAAAAMSLSAIAPVKTEYFSAAATAAGLPAVMSTIRLEMMRGSASATLWPVKP